MADAHRVIKASNAPLDNGRKRHIAAIVAVEFTEERGAGEIRGFAMEAQFDDKALEDSLAESLGELVPETQSVSDNQFVEVVNGALEAVGGTLLFKMRIDDEGQDQHVAAASVGDGGTRQFLLLTLPANGGALKVEPISKSANPVAGIAAAYAGLMDVFKAAA